MNNKKTRKIVFEISGIIIVILIFVFVNRFISREKICSFVISDNSDRFAYQIEDVYVSKEDVVISGWFIKLRKVNNILVDDYTDADVGILLYDLNSEEKLDLDGYSKPKEGMPLTVRWNDRSDINEYYKCEYDYSKCGFEAKVSKSKIDIENGEYQIVFKPDIYENSGISSCAYIDHGKLIFFNPKDRMALNVSGTDLKAIVEEGYCVVSKPEYHICVYQYDKKLYWIADSKYSFADDGQTYIQYQLGTTQFDRLPSDRINNGWYWSNIGGFFESNEITDLINCGEYRVSVRDIPSEYAITGIETGFYSGDKWIWHAVFRPIYLYKG